LAWRNGKLSALGVIAIDNSRHRRNPYPESAMPLSTYLQFASDASFRTFAESRDGFQTLRKGADIEVNGKQVRIALAPDGIRAVYLPEAVDARRAEPPQGVETLETATDVADVLSIAASKNEPWRAMLAAINKSAGVLADHHKNDQPKTSKVYAASVALDTGHWLQEVKLRSGQHAVLSGAAVLTGGGPKAALDAEPPAAVQRPLQAVRDLAMGEHEADYIRRNLDNGNLRSDTYVGAREDEATGTIELCFAVNRWPEVNSAAVHILNGNGEPQEETGCIPEYDPQRCLAENGDLAQQAVWIRLRASPMARQFVSLVEPAQGQQFECLRQALDLLLLEEKGRSEESGGGSAAGKVDTMSAYALAKTEWDGYFDAAHHTFNLAAAFKAGAMTEQQIVADMPALFKPVWVTGRWVADKSKPQGGYIESGLTDRGAFIALPDHSEAFQAALCNDVASERHIPYALDSGPTVVAEVLRIPYLAKTRADLERWLGESAQAVHSLIARGRFRIGEDEYEVVRSTSAEHDIVVRPTRCSPANSAANEQYASTLGLRLTRQLKARGIVANAQDAIRLEFNAIMLRWRAPAGEQNTARYAHDALQSMATDGERPSIAACFHDETFCKAAFLRFDGTAADGRTFDAVFQSPDGNEKRLTFSNRHEPGQLSGNVLRDRIANGPDFTSLSHLAAQWVFERHETSLRMKLLSVVERAVQSQNPDSDMKADSMRHVIDACDDLSLHPFCSLSSSAFLRQPLAFASLGHVDALMREPADVTDLTKAKTFSVGGRQYSVHAVDDGVKITEQRRSFLQAIKAIFRMDDATSLSRSINRRIRPKAAADKIRAALEKKADRLFAVTEHTAGLPTYLHDAIAAMTMATSSRESMPVLRARMDDPFLCRANFAGLQRGKAGDTMTASFIHGDRREDIALSDIDYLTSGELQGDVLASWLKHCDYVSLHDLVRKWTSVRAAREMRHMVDTMPESGVKGWLVHLRDYRPFYRRLPGGAVLEITKRPLFPSLAAL
jgi:hypothetical protein